MRFALLAIFATLFALPAAAQNITTYIGADGVPVRVTPSKPLPVTGGSGGSSDATAANQTTQITRATETRDRLPATLGPTTAANSLSIAPASDAAFPISASALPLPSGAATSALQATGNTSVGNVDTDIGAPADAAWTSGSGSVISILKNIAGSNAGSLPAGSATIGNTGGLNTPGATMTGGGNRVGGIDSGGLYRDVSLSTTGVLDSPRAGTGNRVVTKTNLSSNTSTTICPTATAPISTEIFFTTAGVGISLSGGTLTTATIGTTAGTTPDLSFATAATLYTLPVPPTNAITAYGAAGIVVCIQNLRQ